MIISFVTATINSLGAEKSSVEEYVELINKNKKRALDYEFPNDDARMYEAEEKTPEGRD